MKIHDHSEEAGRRPENMKKRAGGGGGEEVFCGKGGVGVRVGDYYLW